MTIEKFEDLECWQKGRELVKQVYALTMEREFSKDFGLKDQIRRAAVSVISNIAEGFESYSNKDFIRYLGYAISSMSEVQSQLYVAIDLEYCSQTYETYKTN